MQLLFLFPAFIAVVAAHSAAEKPKGTSWQEWHMKEEHQMDSFDLESFFNIHDLQNKGFWNANDILYVYGLTRDEVVGDGSGMGEHAHDESISQSAKDQVTLVVLTLMDADKNGQVSKEEWMKFMNSGNELPDFGYGPGHHMDFESEYENHHWNKYHKDQDPDVHVKHKEDIEHELLHHAHEIEETHSRDPGARKISQDFLSPVKVKNVPQKYLANA